MTEKVRRFYRGASIERDSEGWSVRLDGRGVRTPAGRILALPAEGLAEAVAAEWGRQGDLLDPVDMPLTRIANVAIDLAPGAVADLVRAAAGYARTDLVSHLDPVDAGLRRRQRAVLDPLRSWAGEVLGVHLEAVEGVVPAAQPDASVEAAAAYLRGLDLFRLTGAAHAAGLFSSIVLAAALERGRLTGRAAFEASRIEEDWQAAHWGMDAEAAAKAKATEREALALEVWFYGLSKV